VRPSLSVVADTGAADARLEAAVRAWTGSRRPAALAEVHAALVTARVFAAITARATTVQHAPATGPPAESSAEMALLTLVASGGERALPVFLDATAAVGFRPAARPVPRSGQEMGRAALDDGAQALLIEPAGAALVVTGADLLDLAAGRVPVAGAALSARRTGEPLRTPTAADPELLAALATALRGEPVRAARLLDGPDGPVLGVVPADELDVAALAALAERVLPRLGGHRLDLAAVPPSGPGLPVALAPRPGRARWPWRR